MAVLRPQDEEGSSEEENFILDGDEGTDEESEGDARVALDLTPTNPWLVRAV